MRSSLLLILWIHVGLCIYMNSSSPDLVERIGVMTFIMFSPCFYPVVSGMVLCTMTNPYHMCMTISILQWHNMIAPPSFSR